MSYELGDELIDGVVSNCCSARVIEGNRCNKCKENCDVIKEGVQDEF